VVTTQMWVGFARAAAQACARLHGEKKRREGGMLGQKKKRGGSLVRRTHLVGGGATSLRGIDWEKRKKRGTEANNKATLSGRRGGRKETRMKRKAVANEIKKS